MCCLLSASGLARTGCSPGPVCLGPDAGPVWLGPDAVPVWSGSGRMQSESGLASDLGSEDPFTLLMDPPDTWSRITLEPINGDEAVFPEAVTIFTYSFKRKSIRFKMLSL